MPISRHSPAPWRIVAAGWIVNLAGEIIGRLNHWPGTAPLTPRELQGLWDGKLIERAPELLRMCGALRLVLDATSMYAPPAAQATVQTMLDESAALLRSINT